MSPEQNPDLSIVVPCFNEEESLPLFAKELARTVEMMRSAHGKMAVELVLIDDGSSDGTVPAMRELARQSDLPYRVRWFALSRNFGKESALYAGLVKARGTYVATMDADMQDPPALLVEMYERIVSGDCDSVATRRVDRKGEPPVRSFFARLFYRIINRLSDIDLMDGARDFRLMTRPMVEAVLAMSERNRFTKGIYSWVGFRTEWIAYENIERRAGESKWNFGKLAAYALDGITAFSTVPLALASVMGIVICFVALAFAAFVFIRAAVFDDPVDGWPSLMTAVLLIGGVQLLCLGVIGNYLAKTYIETKSRPIYLIRAQGDSRDSRDEAGRNRTGRDEHCPDEEGGQEEVGGSEDGEGEADASSMPGLDSETEAAGTIQEAALASPADRDTAARGRRA